MNDKTHRELVIRGQQLDEPAWRKCLWQDVGCDLLESVSDRDFRERDNETPGNSAQRRAKPADNRRCEDRTGTGREDMDKW